MTSSNSASPFAPGWLTTIADAVVVLSRHRLNAVLIVAESTSVVSDEGIAIGGRLSEALLVTLFVPDSLTDWATAPWSSATE